MYLLKMLLLSLANELLNCYSSANIQYNENLKTATIQLSSTRNDDCNKFAFETMFNLSFNDNWQSQQYIIDTFNYSNQVKFVMSGVVIINGTENNTELPNYAKLNISNLAYWTIVQVSFLGRQTSQMDKCFDESLSTFVLTRTQFKFEVFLTSACQKEITEDAIEFQYQFNQKADTIQIVRQDSSNINQTSYNCNTITSNTNGMLSFQCTNQDDYSVDVQTPFTKPVVQFFIPSAGVIYSTEITFTNKTVGLMNEFFIKKNLAVFKDMLQVEALSTTDQDKLNQLEQASLGFDQIIYRLTIKTPLETFTFQWKYFSFDYSRSLFIFQCLNDMTCIDNMVKISDTRKDSTYYFDMSTFEGIVNLAYIGEPFSLSLSCFQRLVIEIVDKTSLCVVLEKSPLFNTSERCMKFKDGPVNFTGKAVDADNNSYEGFSQTSSGIFYFSQPRLCFECVGCEYQIQDFLKPSLSMQFEAKQNGQIIAIIGNQANLANYDEMNIIVCTCAGGLIVAALVDSITKMVIFSRLLKSVKTHKRK